MIPDEGFVVVDSYEESTSYVDSTLRYERINFVNNFIKIAYDRHDGVSLNHLVEEALEAWKKVIAD